MRLALPAGVAIPAGAVLLAVVALPAGTMLLAGVAVPAGPVLLAGVAIPAGPVLLAMVPIAVLRGFRKWPLRHRGAAFCAEIAVIVLHTGDDLRHVGNMCRAQPHRVRRACGALLRGAHLCRPRGHSERQRHNQRTSRHAKLACPPQAARRRPTSTAHDRGPPPVWPCPW